MLSWRYFMAAEIPPFGRQEPNPAVKFAALGLRKSAQPLTFTLGSMTIGTLQLLIRTAMEDDITAIASLHICSWQAAYKGIVPNELLDSRDIDASIRSWRSTLSSYPENLVVAQSGNGMLVGFCCSGPVVDSVRNGNFEFEIYGLHVDPSHYRQGIGSALLANSFSRMNGLGLAKAIVWTLEDLVRSRHFYEKNGGKLVNTGVWNVAGYNLNEVAYGWQGQHAA